ncbi:probable methyltransferase PMT11 [Magnolia sinica]|uniref:probable methyltransferase PMT11 n=1 Tax=Magnolia sinica TaxID=86752 RepID=UPI0026592FC7|nr:probable methyltransferase PMT11 [Magnolia sinica]
MLEMDRMLRPGGHAYILDTISIIEEVQEIAVAMGWRTALHDTSEGPYASRRMVSEYKEAKEIRVNTVPVLVGPVSYLLLSKLAKGVEKS